MPPPRESAIPEFDITRPTDLAQSVALAALVLRRFRDGAGPFTPGDAGRLLDTLEEMAGHCALAGSPLEPGERVIVPAMETLRETFVVKRPDAEMAPPQIGQYGGLSLGAHHIEEAGAVMSVAVHHPDGATLIATFGLDGYTELAHAFNRWGQRIQAGDFDKPAIAS